jgi:hypothetical protein
MRCEGGIKEGHEGGGAVKGVARARARMSRVA